jgi:hypothetical protein
MATLGELISDVQERVVAARPNDELRINIGQIKFVLDYCTAFVINKRAKEDMVMRKGSLMYVVDPSLFTRHELALQEDANGQLYADLPVLPMSLPVNFGIGAITTTGDPRRGYSPKKIPSGTQSDIEIEMGRPFGSSIWNRVGQRVYFYQMRLIRKVYAYIIGVELPNDSNDCFSQPYPLPQDLIAETLQMVVGILLNEVSLQDDTQNDGKDQTVKGQQ